MFGENGTSKTTLFMYIVLHKIWPFVHVVDHVLKKSVLQFSLNDNPSGTIEGFYVFKHFIVLL
jgi:hypothetical protein